MKDIEIKDPDVKDVTLEGKGPEELDSISLSLSPHDKYDHMLAKKMADTMRGTRVAKKQDGDIRVLKCSEIFYNVGQIYDKESGYYSGSIAQMQAASWATAESGSFAILKDDKENCYVFLLDSNLELGRVSEDGLTDIETVSLPAGYSIDRIITNDKSQLVPKDQHFGIEPSPSATTPTGSISINTPIVFVPGVMGSELVRGGATVWPSTKEAIVKSLELDETGKDTAGMVAPSKVMRHFPVLGGLYKAPVYHGFFKFFEDNGYKEGVDLFGFAYDWRKDLEDAGKELESLIKEVSEKTIGGKVVLVAHSLGGLVARAFMLKPENHGLVARFFILGTPHHGAPKYMSTLLFGKEWPLPWIAVKLSEPDAKKLVRNFTSIYQGTLDHTAPITMLYNDGSPVDLKNLDVLFPGQFNAGFVSKAIAFHDALNKSWARFPFYKTHLMVSSELVTILQIKMKAGKFDSYDKKKAGDATIPAFSSKRLAPNKDHTRIHEFVNVEHQALAVDKNVLGTILGIIRPSTPVLSLHPGPLPVWELCNTNQGGKGPLVQGDPRKDLVRHLQLLLVNVGHDLSHPGSADGIDGDFGSITAREVRKFQQSHKDNKNAELVQDGVVGPLTADALNRAVVATGMIHSDDYFTPDDLYTHYQHIRSGDPIP